MNVSVVNGVTEQKTPDKAEQLLLGDVLKLEQLELDPEPPIQPFKEPEYSNFIVKSPGPSYELKQPEANKGVFLTQFRLSSENSLFKLLRCRITGISAILT